MNYNPTKKKQRKQKSILNVILEFYIDTWYCYPDSKNVGMAYALFTAEGHDARNLMYKVCELHNYSVVQEIDMTDEEEMFHEMNDMDNEWGIYADIIFK